MSEAKSKVILTNKNYLAEAKMRNHFSVLDRPLNKGGGDTGPTPVEYLLTAIAGCVSMTLRIYLEQKDWDVGKITVEVHQKEKLTKQGVEKTLIEEISFENEITKDQKEKLLSVAGRCPVIKMIKGETKVISKIL